MKTKNDAKDVSKMILKSGIISWIFIVGIWYFGSLQYSDYFLPGPGLTLKSLKQLVDNGLLFQDIAASSSRSLKGWLLAIITGVPLGLIIGNFKPARWIVEPILTFFRFVPAITLTSLFLMWFGTDDTSRVALILYSAFFPVFVNSVAGVASTEKSLIEAASCMGANRIRIFFTVILPSAVPSIFTGIRLGLSNSLHTIIAAEMLVGNNGLGYLINSSKLYYRTSWAFAGIVTLAILGFVYDRALVLIGNKLLKRFGVKQ